MALYLSILMAQRCSIDTVQKVTSSDLNTSHTVVPNGHQPIRSTAALGIMASRVTPRSAMEREARNKFDDSWRAGVVRRVNRTNRLVHKEKEMIDRKMRPAT